MLRKPGKRPELWMLVPALTHSRVTCTYSHEIAHQYGAEIHPEI